jgi:hypothetical protein
MTVLRRFLGTLFGCAAVLLFCAGSSPLTASDMGLSPELGDADMLLAKQQKVLRKRRTWDEESKAVDT